MYSPSSHVYGYHGTYRQAADLILSEGFKLSNNDYDWLGRGVYFFQDGQVRARQWAQELCSKKGISHDNAVVIRCTISLDKCLDLVDVAATGLLIEGHRQFEHRCQRSGVSVPIQKGGLHKLDCAVINFTVDVVFRSGGQEVYSVRCIFEEGGPIFPTSAITGQGHIQVAVRNFNAILLTEEV